jgi:hypothetical protein
LVKHLDIQACEELASHMYHTYAELLKLLEMGMSMLYDMCNHTTMVPQKIILYTVHRLTTTIIVDYTYQSL